ncbi:MAG: hypothetical protein Q9159_006643 [Coniocarpon cinnabarinum]
MAVSEQVRYAVSQYPPDMSLDGADFVLEETAHTRAVRSRYYYGTQRTVEQTPLSLDLSREESVPLSQIGTALGHTNNLEETLVDHKQ